MLIVWFSAEAAYHCRLRLDPVGAFVGTMLIPATRPLNGSTSVTMNPAVAPSLSWPS